MSQKTVISLSGAHVVSSHTPIVPSTVGASAIPSTPRLLSQQKKLHSLAQQLRDLDENQSSNQLSVSKSVSKDDILPSFSEDFSLTQPSMQHTARRNLGATFSSDVEKQFALDFTTAYNQKKYSAVSRFFSLPPVFKIKKFAIVFMIIALIAVPIVIYTIYNAKPAQAGGGITNTLQVGVNRSIQFDESGYKEWSQKLFGKLVSQTGDEDEDQLNNREEFLIGSNPTQYSTCNNGLSDAHTLYELIDPKTCKKIEISDDEVLNRLSQVIDLKKLNTQLASRSVETANLSSSQSLISNLLNESGILSKDELKSVEQKIEEQKKYASLLDKIDAYVKEYRSYAVFDRDYATPVQSVVFLRVSLKYKIPLKYVMAVARLESRFGTDRFNDSGAETRIGMYHNIFSIGLDDSGGNQNYVTWEDGVEAFGRWYGNMESKGVSDCAKWRIYNPNGDYCSKVEQTATGFEKFMR